MGRKFKGLKINVKKRPTISYFQWHLNKQDKWAEEW